MMKTLFLFLLLPFLSLYSFDGVEYSYLELPNNSYMNWVTSAQGIHILEIDPEKVAIQPVRALDDGLGRESVLSMANRHEAIAAVNSSFFAIGGTYSGRATQTLKVRDWYSLPFKQGRGCIGWSLSDQTPLMDRLKVSVSLQCKDELISLHGLNRPRREQEAVAYTPCFHRTTLTNPDGKEIIVINGKITAIHKGGSSKIPEEGFVLSIQENHPLLNSFEIGDPLALRFSVIPELQPQVSWDALDFIVGGTPLLFHEEKKALDVTEEKTYSTFLENRHSRTAVGILPNGHWIFVVVDRTTIFDGMTIDELTTLMTELGCIAALNLDGGKSSTMVYNGQIINTPHGDEEEGSENKMTSRVSDCIVFRKK